MGSSLRRLLHRTLSLFRRQPLDQSLEAEIAAHIEFAVDENIARGLSPEQARREALLRFGGVQQAKEQQRAERGWPQVEILLQDLRYTLRTLARDRSFTIVAVLILSLGIAANIAVFSVVDTILLRPLPFAEPTQLLRIGPADPKGGLSSATYSADLYDQLQQQNQSFQQVTGYYAFSATDNLKLTGSGDPIPFSGLMVTENFFQTFGVQPILGRLFTTQECHKGGPPAVLLSYSFWKRQFSGDRDIAGRQIAVNGGPATVIGVLPESFDYGAVFAPGTRMDAFTPAVLDNMRDEGNTLALFARLKPGIGIAQAQGELNSLFPKLYASVKYANSIGVYTAVLTGMKEYVSGKLRRSLVVLWCAVGMILLIVCVNLSNLLLARAATRSKEFALRKALGAGRGRLVRQLLTESLVLSAAGALVGLGMAYALIFWLAHQGSIILPLLSSVRVDSSVLLWTLGITLLTAILFGLLPGFRMSGTNLQEALKSTGQGTSEGRQHDRLRSTLVISEVALACVLLVGAGLLLRSFLHILDVDLGFEPSRAAAIKLDYDGSWDPARRSVYFQEVLQKVKDIPGIESAGITDSLPLDRNRSWGISAKGHSYRKGELQDTFVYIITPGYLSSIGMHLVAGRDFDAQDTATAAKSVIINETVAQRLWPGEDAIGKMAKTGDDDLRVVGVIADVRESSAENAAGWQMYMPTTQQYTNPTELVVRTRLPAAVLAPTLMSALRSLNPAQPKVELRPLQQLVDRSTSPRRFFVLLVGIFAALGLFLASLGIYGVISYSVTRQTQEIGIRMALGATLARVQFDVVARTLRLVAVGILIGTMASLFAATLIASMLYGTSATDPLTFVGMILLLAGVSLVAGYIPARRASRINPMTALRNA